MERTVWEEQSRLQELKSRIVNERTQTETETKLVRAEKDRLLAEINEKKRVEAERLLRIEQEKRKEEEERLRRIAEEQRKALEEERKLKYYRAGDREEPPAPPPPPPLKVTESGVFLVMKESEIHQEPRESSKVVFRAEKYHLFNVINSRKDEYGNQWSQVVVSEKVVTEKGRRLGWSPEDRSYWLKNKLPVWVYPGDVTNVSNIKPLRMKVEDVQFTGKTSVTAQKQPFYEVSYFVNISSPERVLGWIHEKDGIRRAAKNIDEMRELLNGLSKTFWPIRIQEDVLRGYIRQGFSREQVVLSWGRPDHVNTTRTFVGVHEQWVYGEAPFPKSYVYFENGLVKSWEFFGNQK